MLFTFLPLLANNFCNLILVIRKIFILYIFYKFLFYFIYLFISYFLNAIQPLFNFCKKLKLFF